MYFSKNQCILRWYVRSYAHASHCTSLHITAPQLPSLTIPYHAPHCTSLHLTAPHCTSLHLMHLTAPQFSGFSVFKYVFLYYSQGAIIILARSLVSTKSLTTWNLELIGGGGGLVVNDGWLVPNSCNDKYQLI